MIIPSNQMSSPQLLIDEKNSRFWVYENFTPDYYQYLTNLKLLIEPKITVFGRPGSQKRNIGFFSDQSVGYTYSNQIIPSIPLSQEPIMLFLLNMINSYLNTTFNGILVNEYIDGSKCLGAHSDSETGLDKNRKMVACLAYGATRIFRIKRKLGDGKSEKVLDYQHNPGTLLVMEGDFQTHFTHEIPPQLKIKQPRISLTFRNHII